MKRSKLLNLVSLIVFGILSQACDPVPRHDLTNEEKLADMEWIYSQFGHNYAPLQYKQSRYAFDYESLKKTYSTEAAKTKFNEEFYLLMYKFIAEFKDAHTSGSLTPSDLKGRAKIAFMGFSGKRKGDTYVVSELLPTISKESNFPIKAGAVITKIDGVTLPEYVRKNLVSYRDLGSDEANLTYHMNKIFNRSSILNPMPTGLSAVLTVKDDDKEIEFTVPWIVKDYVEFQAQQAAAKKKDALVIAGSDGKKFNIGFLGFDGLIQFPSTMAKKIVSHVLGVAPWDNFKFIDNVSSWTSDIKLDANGNPLRAAETETPADQLKKVRYIPEKAVFLKEGKTFPSYLSFEKTYDTNGKETTEKKLVGTIWIPDFSEGSEEEFKEILAIFASFGVQHLVIDTINNGGGSLVLGMKMAQALSPKKIKFPGMQFGLNDTWLDNMESAANDAPSDAESELYKRVYNGLLEDKKAGAKISHTFSSEELAPFAIQGNADLEQKFKVVLLVNEMCASMCDIFASILKDNNLATVVGAKTMGAGGNVVDIKQAPNSHLDLRQTESLILNLQGGYLENNGVDPDVALKVNESSTTKYAAVIKEGLKTLLKADAPVPNPIP